MTYSGILVFYCHSGLDPESEEEKDPELNSG